VGGGIGVAAAIVGDLPVVVVELQEVVIP